QGRNLAGRGSLDGPTQTLPTLYSVPASDFRPIAPIHSNGGGANTSTGRGTPVAPSLVADLVASQTNMPLGISALGAPSSRSAPFRRKLKKAAHNHAVSLPARRPFAREHVQFVEPLPEAGAAATNRPRAKWSGPLRDSRTSPFGLESRL